MAYFRYFIGHVLIKFDVMKESAPTCGLTSALPVQINKWIQDMTKIPGIFLSAFPLWACCFRNSKISQRLEFFALAVPVLHFRSLFIVVRVQHQMNFDNVLALVKRRICFFIRETYCWNRQKLLFLYRKDPVTLWCIQSRVTDILSHFNLSKLIIV